MITTQDLRVIARTRLKDAESLLAAGQYDGAVYLCGYAVEVALKAPICRHLKWAGFPRTNREFEGLNNLKTHDFETLLKLTGLEDKVKRSSPQEWARVLDWSPEARYDPIGGVTRHDAEVMIEAARTLLGVFR